MDQSSQLAQKYAQMGLDPTVVRQVYYTTPSDHRERLFIDDNFFFDQYQRTQ